jgi:hypothetical protein
MVFLKSDNSFPNFLVLDEGDFFVQDIDCMPSNPFDNMPEALRRQIGARKASFMTTEPQINGNSSFGGCEVHSSPVKVRSSLSASVKQGKVGLLTSINMH